MAPPQVLRAVARHLSPSGAAAAASAPEELSQRDVARKTTLSAEELRFYEAHGFLYVPGVIDADACDVLHDEVLEVCEKDPKINLTHAQLLEGSARDGDMLRQSAMHTKEQLLYSFRNSPNLIDLASQAVGGEAMLYNGFTAVKGASGGGLFDLHQVSQPQRRMNISLCPDLQCVQDNMYTRHDNGDRTEPRRPGHNNDGWGSCGVWVALCDLPDPSNGCLIVAVDSHLHGTLAGEDYTSDRGTDKQLEMDSPVRSGEVLPIRMRKGDLCIFNRATVHGSLPNTSGQVRVGYGLQYNRRDVNWLDRSTGDENTGEWHPLSAGSSPFRTLSTPPFNSRQLLLSAEPAPALAQSNRSSRWRSLARPQPIARPRTART